MRRFLNATIAIVIAFSLMAAAASSPATAVDPSSGMDGSYMYVYEADQIPGEQIREDHYTHWKVDIGSISNLGNWSLGLFAGCDFGFNNWNNCISDLYLYLRAGSCVSVYNYTNYSGLLRTYYARSTGTSYGWAIMTGLNNNITSIRWGDWVEWGSTPMCVYGPYD